MSQNRILFVDEFVTVRWYHKTRAHYELLGYVYAGYLVEFQVRPSELSTGSHVRVLVRCPVCNDVRQVPVKDVLASGNSVCKRCSDVRDLTGQRFGRLTVLRPSNRRIGRNIVWECVCDCGNTAYLSSAHAGKYDHCCNRGACNHRWNEGLSRKERLYHRGRPKYVNWRKFVFERDGYTCQVCGDNAGGNLAAHHMDSWDTHQERRFDVSNGVTLCEVCHKDFHDSCGYGRNTEGQYKEWATAARCAVF